MIEVPQQLGDGRSINGECEPGFEGVLAAFRANFERHDEIGASVCLTHRGKTVVDLWGGLRDSEAEWERDTVSIVYSCTKGATALCAHIPLRIPADSHGNNPLGIHNRTQPSGENH